jgi:hypothetical protein
VILVERNDAHYALTIGTLGRPDLVQPIQGRMTVWHRHAGFGAYSLKISAPCVGENTPTIDPLCAALIGKGWSHRTLSFEYGQLSQPRDGYILKRAWEDDTSNFYISDVSTPEWWRLFGTGLPAWLIKVEWYQDKPHLFVEVSFPKIYDDPKELTALLEAINTLPHANTFKDMHPAVLA